ncbi:MAG: hypothetical protein R3F11_04060 [Verrucomicrobiales bacterium]
MLVWWMFAKTLAVRGARFLLEQRFPADAQIREDGDEQDEDPHPAQPLGERPPEQDRRVVGVEVADDRSAGGGEPGHRFEKRLRRVHRRIAQHVGQGSEEGADDPAQPDDGDGLAPQDVVRLPFPKQSQRDPHAERHARRDAQRDRRIAPRIAPMREQRDQQAAAHHCAEQDEQKAEDAGDEPVIHGI